MLQSARIRNVLSFMAILAIATVAVWWTTRVPETLLQDIDGVTYGSLERPANGGRSVLFFLTPDCPIANQYAPEIRRICDKYASSGTNCFLVYADPSLSRDTIRQHAREYHESRYPAILDADYRLLDAAGATVSSETAVFSSQGKLEYRGRIDDFNAALGVPRQKATQHDLRDALDALVAGRSIPRPRTETVGCFLPTRTSGAPS
jgi:hypothetical protein